MAAPRGYRQRKARERLAAVRLNDPRALPDVKPGRRGRFSQQERRAILQAKRSLPARTAPEKKPPRYNPLAPLTGEREQQERQAATRLQFGDRERELRNALASREQTAANTSTYYDDYRQALREASARVNEANRQNVKDQEARVDTATSQDKAGVEARDAAASEEAAKFGRPAQVSEQGHQAVEARRTAGNADVATIRGRESSDIKYMALREASGALGKAQAMAREAGKTAQLRGEDRDLARDKGDFKVKHRADAREGERQWAAIQKEFGLKERGQDLEFKQNRKDRNLERQKLAAQKIVARIYASADKAGARSQIRVAQLQLEKGKIDRNQFRTIKNIYEGLPEKGVSPAAKKGGSGGTANLQNWEIDKVDNAVERIRATKAAPGDKARAIRVLVESGLPPRLARIAWAKYAKGLTGRESNPRGANG